MTNKTNIIKGKNNYSFEGSPTGKSWTFEIIQGIEFLTDELKEKIADFKESIFFNDSNSKYYFFDYNIDDVWIEGLEIDCNNMIMKLSLFQ